MTSAALSRGRSAYGARTMDPLWIRDAPQWPAHCGTALLQRHCGDWTSEGGCRSSERAPNHAGATVTRSSYSSAVVHEVIQLVDRSCVGGRFDGQLWGDYPGVAPFGLQSFFSNAESRSSHHVTLRLIENNRFTRFFARPHIEQMLRRSALLGSGLLVALRSSWVAVSRHGEDVGSSRYRIRIFGVTDHRWPLRTVFPWPFVLGRQQRPPSTVGLRRVVAADCHQFVMPLDPCAGTRAHLSLVQKGA